MLVPNGRYSDACAAGLTADVVCQTDNASVYYYMDSSGEYELEEVDRVAVRAALARYNATDLSVTYDSTPVFSGSGETDIVYQEGSFGMDDSIIGITWCNDPVNSSTYECDQTYIRIRGGGNYSERVAGHESGHAVGLLHGAQTDPLQTNCDADLGIMRTPLSCITSAALGATAIANINWVY